MRDFVAKLLAGLVIGDPKFVFCQVVNLIALHPKPSFVPAALFPVLIEAPLLFDFHRPGNEGIAVFPELFFKLSKFARQLIDPAFDELFTKTMDDRASVFLFLLRDRSLLQLQLDSVWTGLVVFKGGVRPGSLPPSRTDSLALVSSLF